MSSSTEIDADKLALSKLEELEEELEKENITVRDFAIPGMKCYAVTFDEVKAIAIDNKQITSCAEKRCLLEHEREHLNMPETMYTLDMSIYACKRKEHIINRNIIKRLIPYDKLVACLEKEKQLCEIADEFGITVDLLTKAIEYYYLNFSHAYKWGG